MVAVLVLFALLIVWGIFSPHVAWYFVDPNAKVTVDGRKVHGWLHRGNHGQTLFLTRNNGRRRESYMIGIGGQGSVSDCGNWTAPRFPVFPLGDVSPPCLWIVDSNEKPNTGEAPPSRKLVAGTDFVEFTADDGSRIRVSW
jgi:hypothetical protein